MFSYQNTLLHHSRSLDTNSQFFNFFIQVNGELRIIKYDGIGVKRIDYSMKIQITEQADNQTWITEWGQEGIPVS